MSCYRLDVLMRDAADAEIINAVDPRLLSEKIQAGAHAGTNRLELVRYAVRHGNAAAANVYGMTQDAVYAQRQRLLRKAKQILKEKNR